MITKFTPLRTTKQPYAPGLISQLAAEAPRLKIVQRDFYGTLHKFEQRQNRRLRRADARAFLRSI